MAVVQITSVPNVPGSGYERFRSWLCDNFDHLCSYCLLQHESLEVEHYEPQAYAPKRQSDPSNLLLACKVCNGGSGKGDYHPQHRGRRRLPNDDSGHLVIDVRRDDLAEFFEIDREGSIVSLPNSNRPRANWNIATLKLDRDGCTQARRQILSVLEAAEAAVVALADQGQSTHRRALERCLEAIVPELSGHLLMLETYEVALSEELRRQLIAHRRQHRGL